MAPARILPLRPTFSLIDLDCLAHNIRELRRITPPAALLMAVVKADAYGLGLREAAPICLANGADCLGVAILDEALTLRQSGIDAAIVILGATAPWQAEEIVRQGLAATVCSLEAAEALSAAAMKQGRPALVHIKVDSGMNRLGIWPDERGLRLVESIALLPGLQLEGIFTHFASADETDKSFAREQFEMFMDFADTLASRGVRPRLRHAANSAALLDLPETHLDMVRPGVLVPGLWPSEDVTRRIEVRPVLSLITHVAQVKEVPAGRKVSYGCTYTTGSPSVLATLPLGYHDGYRRGFSNRAAMLVAGVRAPVRGRVCMDQTVIDVSAVPGVRTGDAVVAMGHWGAETVSADELAGHIGTIGYEIATTVGRRVPRLYVHGGRPVRLTAPLGEWTVGGWEDLPWPDVEATYLATRIAGGR